MNTIKKFLNYVLIGVITIIPIAIVLQVVLFFKNLVVRLFFGVYGYSESYPYTIMAFSLTFALFWLIGYETKHHKSHLFRAIDFVIDRIPILNSVYRVSKKLLSMIRVEDRVDDPREVVYIEYPKVGLWVPAYVTNRQGDMYVVYVPTSPNPTSGFTVIVHKSMVVHSKMNLEEVTSFIVSVGSDYDRSAEVRELPTRIE